MPKIKFFVTMLHFKIRHLNVGINIRGFSAIKCDSTIAVFTILNKKYCKYIIASKAKPPRRRGHHQGGFASRRELLLSQWVNQSIR